MKKKLQSALEAADIPAVRTILIEMIDTGYNRTNTLQDITSTLPATPGLFEPDDGKTYAPTAAQMTETLIESLREDLSRNFSLHKFRLFTEARLLTHGDPHYFANREREVTELIEDPAGEMEIREEIIDNRITSANVTTPGQDCGDVWQTEGCCDVADTASPSDSQPHRAGNKALRVVGLILMLAGAAAAITALCVPVTFLLGVGIGIILLGIALTYAALPR